MVVVLAALYGALELLGLPGWVGGIAVIVVAVPRLASGRAHLSVDEERMVSVEGGRRGDPIWWDTVDTMYVERRRPPWVLRAVARGDAALAERPPDHVIVVRLKTGAEVPLWSIASNGGRAAVADPAGRLDGILAQLERVRGSSLTRVASDATVPMRRVTLPGAILKGRRNHLLVDDERLVPVVRGHRGRTIWWDTVEGLCLERRPSPSEAENAAEMSHVIVVRLADGVEVPLWGVALRGGPSRRANAELRVDAVLAQLEALHRPSAVRATSVAGSAKRLRPPDHLSHFGFTAFWALPSFAVPYWLLEWPWWVGAIAAAWWVFMGLTEVRTFLLVDAECIVPEVRGVRGRPIWWDTVEVLAVDERPRPRWAPGADSGRETGKPISVVIAHLTTGEEIPLWAASVIDDGDSEGAVERAVTAVLARLTALRPPLATEQNAGLSDG